MTIAAPSDLSSDPVSASAAKGAQASGPSVYDLPEGYDAVRADSETQFAPLELKDLKPREPAWWEEWLKSVFEWLGEVFAPVAEALVANWPVVKWVLIALLACFVLILLWRLVGPLAQRRSNAATAPEAEPEWQPDRAETLALLEDADRLAADGHFDEAARLLLRRSIGQIAAARPEWVEPSSTARELARLPRLSDAARSAFGVISEAVERSLFALRQLDRSDWERARAAYANFALTRIDAGKASTAPTNHAAAKGAAA